MTAPSSASLWNANDMAPTPQLPHIYGGTTASHSSAQSQSSSSSSGPSILDASVASSPWTSLPSNDPHSYTSQLQASPDNTSGQPRHLIESSTPFTSASSSIPSNLRMVNSGHDLTRVDPIIRPGHTEHYSNLHHHSHNPQLSHSYFQGTSSLQSFSLDQTYSAEGSSYHPQYSQHQQQSQLCDTHPQPSYSSSNPAPIASTSSFSSSRSPSKPAGPTKPNRHLACSFCRGRKLKCIIDEEGTPCRQCQRRNLECNLPIRHDDPIREILEQHAQEGEEGQHGEERYQGQMRMARKRRVTDHGAMRSELHQDATRGPSGSPRRKKRTSGPPVMTHDSNCSQSDVPSTDSGHRSGHVPNQLDHDHLNAQEAWDAILQPPDPTLRRQFGPVVVHNDNGPLTDDLAFGLAASGDTLILTGSKDHFASNDIVHTTTSPPSSSMADLPSFTFSQAVYRPPVPPPRWSTDWWDRCLNMFGHRPQSIRIVENLLSRFVATHSTMLALVHGPSLMDSLRREQLRNDVHPALVFAVLATSVCDLQAARPEPYLADISTVDSATQRLAGQLRQTALEYVEAGLMDASGLTVALGQAVSVLVLTSPNGQERNRLFSIVEAIVKSSHLIELEPSSDSLDRLPAVGSREYYEQPKLLNSPATEIKRESTNRMCKTQAAHAARVVIAKPDEDFSAFGLPRFILNTRAHDYWDPSSLPKPFSSSFWASRHFARAASILSKVFIIVSNLPLAAQRQSAFENSQRSDVKAALQGLADVEKAFQWLHGQDQEVAGGIFPREGQVFLVKLHVSVRLSLWRKTGVWKGYEDDLLTATTTSATEENAGDVLLPSFDWWLVAFSSCINNLESDSRQNLQGSGPLQCTNGEVESSLRHVRVGIQMLTVLDYTHYGIQKLLTKALSILQVQVDLRPWGLCADMKPLKDFFEQVRGEIDVQRRNQQFIWPHQQQAEDQSGNNNLPVLQRRQQQNQNLFADINAILENPS
ncbi:unnamed protein product [Sympodiomycopsis kandeliae]